MAGGRGQGVTQLTQQHTLEQQQNKRTVKFRDTSIRSRSQAIRKIGSEKRWSKEHEDFKLWINESPVVHCKATDIECELDTSN